MESLLHAHGDRGRRSHGGTERVGEGDRRVPEGAGVM